MACVLGKCIALSYPRGSAAVLHKQKMNNARTRFVLERLDEGIDARLQAFP